MPKPPTIFDRDAEWDDLTRFVEDPAPGLRIGIVRGRRRYGKSFLLEHLCAQLGGVYTLAVRQSRTMGIQRFINAVSDAVGLPLGRFDTWEGALEAAIEAGVRTAGDRIPVLVVDEFPYLESQAPELLSVIQAIYDRRGPSSGHPSYKLILCGSALSVMSRLVMGDQALYGRTALDLRIGTFDFRDTASYWGADPETALLIDATIGGVPGYRDVIGRPPAAGKKGFATWLSGSLLNPSHALFNEPDYLLAEDPKLTDRALVYAIWEAVAQGATTPTKIGGIVGLETKSLDYYLRLMRAAGFLRHDQDLLLQRRPVITIADPVVRFHNLIVRPNLADLELRNTQLAWQRSETTFDAKVLGPHFEELVRAWATRYGRAEGKLDIGHVGTTVIACREHRGHEVDLVALDSESTPRRKGGRISVIGEAKATTQPRGEADLVRLEHVRDLLTAQGWQADSARLLLASRSGFRPELRTNSPAILLDLHDLYGR
ncbi:ATPase [Microlunatus elymi]|uniref:ATPase n=1 Tax=Microlunatus elymi TaxID=2596828 RepID=A0A516PUN2_9ACTN|nr:AAA family ATPase [Microlunatus elymi]QDP94887.1 ATPase [Microlunatus elymi]